MLHEQSAKESGPGQFTGFRSMFFIGRWQRRSQLLLSHIVADGPGIGLAANSQLTSRCTGRRAYLSRLLQGLYLRMGKSRANYWRQ